LYPTAGGPQAGNNGFRRRNKVAISGTSAGASVFAFET
jgi:hypothetical protein